MSFLGGSGRVDRPSDISRQSANRPPIGARSGPWPQILVIGMVGLLSATILLTSPAASRPAFAQQLATVDDILDVPWAFYGELVTVRGEIGERLGARAFTIEDDDLLFDEHLLVLGARPPPELPTGAISPLADLGGNRYVLVMGVVRRFVVADVERDLGYTPDAALVAAWEGQPVLIAAYVAPIDSGYVR